MPKAKIVHWDLETTNLNANFGFILCGCVKETGKPIKTVAITDFPRYKADPTNDKDVCKALAKLVSEADIWSTWYGARFDVPFLNSRLIYHGEPPLQPTPHVDG